ncbi:50S ribosomal protein L3 [Candidatus Woesearchaeota archaeon]|nr:50S ribosomal protein L3 [Candidatus Woesearchaeota archaeon]
MGKIKRKRPRRGSLQYWPRKRAKRIYPRIRNWPHKKDTKLLGFAGYKAGMTSVIFVDNRPKSSTKGEEIKKPVTIIEVPPLKAIAIKLYGKSYNGLKILGEVWAEKLDKEIARKLTLPKKRKTTLANLKEKLSDAEEIRVLACTQPKLTGFGKKKPEIMEFAIGGEDVKAQFEYASSILSKEILVSDVFKEGELLDIHAITIGKGFQGVIKRFGIRLQSHKAEKGRRKLATLGPWTPKHVPWWTPQAEQMGFRTRTEYNKQLLKIGKSKETPITPKSGLSHYGKVKSQYVLVAGSVPGPKKRLIRFTHAMRPKKGAHTQPPEITHISLGAQN